jgi:hypothetical protein
MTTPQRADQDSHLLQALGIESNRIGNLDTTTFAIKGWTITLVVALVGYYSETKPLELLISAFGSVTTFLLLDLYFRSIQLIHRDAEEEIKKHLRRIKTPNGTEGNIWRRVWPEKSEVNHKAFGKRLRQQRIADWWYTFLFHGIVYVIVVMAVIYALIRSAQ